MAVAINHSDPGAAPGASTRMLGTTSISAGAAFSCGVTTSNNLYCWGEGTGGQLGDGTASDQVVPTQVLDP